MGIGTGRATAVIDEALDLARRHAAPVILIHVRDADIIGELAAAGNDDVVVVN